MQIAGQVILMFAVFEIRFFFFQNGFVNILTVTVPFLHIETTVLQCIMVQTYSCMYFSFEILRASL